jgi:thiamine pyrophosphate-dependent acetolactate synthase large subunit-like protein
MAMSPRKDSKPVNGITGSRALVDTLLREGIDHVFGIPGTQNLAILDALRDTPKIRFILTRHEQGAAFMAYGFARISGKASVVTATEGPGVTNLATGIAAANRAFLPVISVCGVQESAIRERDATQDMDQITFMKPLTKWAYSIPNPQKIQESMRKAFRVAMTEPRGPTHVEASSEILLEDVESEAIEPAAYRNMQLPDCTDAQLDQAYKVLTEAKRPVFVVGRGVLNDNAIEAMAELATRVGIPVATLQYSPDAFPSTHPLALGPLGRNGWESANKTLPQADAIIAIGAHMDVYSTMFGYGIFSRDAKLVHHTAAAGHIGIVFPVSLAITGSTASMIAGLHARAVKAGINKAWTDVAKIRDKHDSERLAVLNPDAYPIQPQYVAHMIREVLPHNGIVVVDAGNAGKHVRNYFRSYQPGTFISIEDWGSVGGAFPIALGAKLARPDRPVIAAAGDMGGLCNFAEFETAIRERIPVVLVVFNDQGLGNERAFQQVHYGGRLFAVDYQNPDFAALARAFGAHGEHVARPQELRGALERALASGKPALVEVMIDQNTLAPVVFKA